MIQETGRTCVSWPLSEAVVKRNMIFRIKMVVVNEWIPSFVMAAFAWNSSGDKTLAAIIWAVPACCSDWFCCIWGAWTANVTVVWGKDGCGPTVCDIVEGATTIPWGRLVDVNSACVTLPELRAVDWTSFCSNPCWATNVCWAVAAMRCSRKPK